jgi:hypothetical protein
MRQYRKETKEIVCVEKIVCNQCGKEIQQHVKFCPNCGKEIPVSNGHENEGVFHADYQWGYFSEKDGQRHRFDLCEKCYDSLLQGFQIPVEIEG